MLFGTKIKRRSCESRAEHREWKKNILYLLPMMRYIKFSVSRRVLAWYARCEFGEWCALGLILTHCPGCAVIENAFNSIDVTLTSRLALALAHWLHIRAATLCMTIAMDRRTRHRQRLSFSFRIFIATCCDVKSKIHTRSNNFTLFK